MARNWLLTMLAGLTTLFLAVEGSVTCANGIVALNVTSAADVQKLHSVLNCTGEGGFDITWYSNESLDRTIEISRMKKVNVTGSGFPTIHRSVEDDNDSGDDFYAGNGTSIFTVSDGSTLHLKKLVLAGGKSGNGGAVDIFSSSFLSVHGCTFLNNTASNGGAIYSHRSAVEVDGTTTFMDNHGNYGGAIYSTRSTVEVDGRTTFKNNYGRFGGAMYVASSAVEIDGRTTFENNYSNEGGAVHAEDSTISFNGNTAFRNNTAEELILHQSPTSITSYSSFSSISSSGGAIYGNASRIQMDGDTVFSHNSAYLGGAVCGFSSEVNMDGSTLIEHNVGDQGGAMYGDFSEIRIAGSTSFVNNSARFGGGIYGYNSSLFTNDGMSRPGGLAGNEGDASHEVEAEPAVLPNIWFIGNTASGLGGAVQVNGFQELQIRGVAFESNYAELGGAVFIASEEPKTTEFSACVFDGNQASEGGAIYLATGSGVDKFSASVFRDNFAEFSGGAIFHTGSLHVVDTRFMANEAGVEGPAIVSIGRVGELSNLTFSDNSFYCRAGEYGYVIENHGVACKACFDEVCARCSTGRFGDTQIREVRTNGMPVCREPPAGATAESSGATVATLSLEKGYYRTSNQSHAVLRCYQTNACLGGINAANYCAPGYTGPYCAVCVDGYTPGIAHTCHECSANTKRLAVGQAIAVGLAALLTAALMFAHLGCVVRDEGGEDTRVARRSWMGKCWSFQVCLVKRLPLSAIKIVVTVWQIISQFGAIAGDVYPEVYTAFVTKLAPVNVDLDVILSYSCIITTDFYDHLLLATITPALVIVTLAGSYMVARKRNSGSDSALRTVLHKHQAATLGLALFVYSPVSYKIFQTFACDKLDDGNSYIRADYSLSCLSSRHSGYKVYALIMVVVYPIGIAALFGYLLVWHRKDLAKPHRQSLVHLKPLCGVWAAYKPSRYFYEVLECGRRISLTIIAAFIPSNTVAQISIVLMFAVVFVFISEAISPFEKAVDMQLYRWGNAIIVASMYVAFLRRVDVGYDTERALLTFSGVLVIANVFMVTTVLLLTACLVRELRGTRETTGTVGQHTRPPNGRNTVERHRTA